MSTSILHHLQVFSIYYILCLLWDFLTFRDAVTENLTLQYCIHAQNIFRCYRRVGIVGSITERIVS